MSETTRRAVLAGAVGVTAVSVLAACGNDSGSNNTASDSSAGSSGPLAKKADIPVGGGKIVEAGGGTVVTQPEAGTFKAFTAICTHQQCVVAEVANNSIVCRCHGSAFSAADGTVTNPPAVRPLEEKKLRMDGDDIYLAS
ncbi:ubiquinol-cytochrome c reductase iron-sulfur subunit [Dactylosporangium sp. CA-092794]|uniref:QcrA and Rieske domain-containing protein n=1 Tax=Dactylosporangium sp. CA-092794 TaxID=3239929 RepID=UPI003D911124